MRVDHVVYAAESDGMLPTAKRVAGALGLEPIDGGLHPRFGTRNTIIPLAEHRFIEVVEVLDHPASDKAPFGQAVRARSEDGGGWLGWVVAVDDMSEPEKRLGRESVPGNRHRPDGVELTWRQIGVRGLMADPQVPFYICWDDDSVHPSHLADNDVRLTRLQIAGDPDRVRDWLDLRGVIGRDRPEWEPGIAFDFVAPKGTPGLLSLAFQTSEGEVVI
ncbi:MAG TPA: VOC family protein [Segeticoccus sp.]|uniref:VOC family protein n=1 Tax=Segeticoccus sp. TaxID=2706531 RepID=UPI002D7FFA86|nr:VOC family protein [Segeticoccus sp.]HET8602000.1 VOC family protein [Segeticoccus sp.]